MVKFRVNTSKTRIESILVHLYEATIASKIISNFSMRNGLVKLCKLEGKEFKLIYQASRDGFRASDFHAKCDDQQRTLTIIRTTNGFVFGAYTAVAWGSKVADCYKADPNAFIFSLINAIRQPQLIPIRSAPKDKKRIHDTSVPANSYRYSSSSPGDFNAICCYSAYGPTFGGGHDIHISNNSNAATSESYSNLGHSFNFTQSAYYTKEAQSFLAGSHKFQTAEIEVFQLN